MRRYLRKAFIIFVIFYALFFSVSFYALAITPGKAITPGTPLTPGTPINPGIPMVPGTPIHPGDSITSGKQGDTNGAPTNGPANPTQMPDGTIIVPNGDGTFTIYKPNIDGTFTTIESNSPQYNSIMDTYKNDKSSSQTKSGKTDSNSPQNYGYDPNADGPGFYDGIKYVVGDAIGQQVNLVGEVLDSNGNYNFGRSGTWKGFLVSTYKLVGQGTGNNYVQLSGDALDGALKGKDVVDGYHNIRSGIQSYQSIAASQSQFGAAAKARQLFTSTGPMTTLSKFNIATAAVGVGFSAYETGTNFNAWKHETNFEKKTDLAGKTISSFGETLMNLGTISASIPTPATEVVGGVLLATGAVLWAAGTGLQWLNKTKTGRKLIRGTVNAFKTAGKKVKELGSKITSGVKSLFGF